MGCVSCLGRTLWRSRLLCGCRGPFSSTPSGAPWRDVLGAVLQSSFGIRIVMITPPLGCQQNTRPDQVTTDHARHLPDGADRAAAASSTPRCRRAPRCVFRRIRPPIPVSKSTDPARATITSILPLCGCFWMRQVTPGQGCKLVKNVGPPLLLKSLSNP